MKSVLKVYSDIAKENPPWTTEEERAFIKKWWRKDRNYFVTEAMKHNLGLVFDLMNKVAFKKDSEDVFQRAVSALVEALRKFKPSKGFKISTWVRNPICWAIRQMQHTYSKQGSILDDISSLNRKYGKTMSVVSVDSTPGGSEEGDSIGNFISQECVHVDYFDMCGMKSREDEEREADINVGIAALLKYIPKQLTKQEQYVIRRMLNGKNMTEISVELKLSRMRISQISAKAFEKIRRSPLAKSLKGLVSPD